MNVRNIQVLKFGGTSLQNAEFIRQSAQIVADRAQEARPFVVVSAIHGVTDALIEISSFSADQQQAAARLVKKLKNQHLDLVEELRLTESVYLSISKLFRELMQVVKDDELRKANKGAWKDHILSIGERASAIIMAQIISVRGERAAPFDARRFIKTDSDFGQAQVQVEQTRRLIQEQVLESPILPVVTGFIGSDSQGRVTTLGRSGSDYTAGLLADALYADHLEIWTDVDGVLTADPRWVPTADSINKLNFDDIAELSAHGANVIHPKTIWPIYGKNTSVLVKNSYNPTYPGTCISSNFTTNGSLKTITVTGPYVWIQVENYHAAPLLDRIKNLLKNEPGAGTIAFRQSSDFEPARILVGQEVFDEISGPVKGWAREHDVDLDLHRDIYKLKKFSNLFQDDEKLTSRIWKLFASRNVQPLSVDRNYTERFVSFLFEEKEARRAARLLNDYLDYKKTIIDLFIAGTGAIGETLLNLLRKVQPAHIQFRLLGICNSRQALWNNRGIDIATELDWQQAEPTEWETLLEKLTETNLHNVIFVDATGSAEVARLYPRLFEKGINVVTPSKLANTFEQSFYNTLQERIQAHNASFRFETTVGAGLPVLSSLQNLKNSGDEIRNISGVVSGTMTYLFNQLEQGVPFSQAVMDARKKGYAEPDPRDDLSGEDVARKFLTIARMLGLEIERDALNVETLIPEALQDVSREQFVERLKDYDDDWKQRMEKALQEGNTLRYVGRLEEGTITIGMQALPKDSPLGQLEGTDNLVQIYSDFYRDTPLIIQGPGAGKEVTAAGVLSDIVKTAKELV